MTSTNKFSMVNGKWAWAGSCENHDRKHPTPKDINVSLPLYLPFKDKNSEYWKSENFLGMGTAPLTKLQSGIIFNSSEGKRLILRLAAVPSSTF